MTRGIALQRLTGAVLTAVTVLVILNEWGVGTWVWPLKVGLAAILVGLLSLQVGPGRLAFVAAATILTVVLAFTDPNWGGVVVTGLATAAFIAAFFSALTTLRNVAATSPAIARAGAFLSAQPPGRRYAALTVGGQGFALLLNYGALQLLGALAMANATSEPDPTIRGHRIRRMLLAIQRGFISTLPWSPLSFAVAISTSVVPGTSWASSVIPGMVTGAILAGIGWALDTIFKPKLGPRPPRAAPDGNWAVMAPLVILLVILVVSVAVLHAVSGVRVIGLVTVIVPVIAVVWLTIQNWEQNPAQGVAHRVRTYLLEELPGYRSELVLLMMAGYIGTVGGVLLGPAMAALGMDVSGLPAWLILVSLVWVIPILGQLGMNPILAVTLIAPLIPSVAVLGVDPQAVVVAITAGWALSGACSPFTATTLLIGSFGGVSAWHVGLRWNGGYTLLAGLALSVWVAVFAMVF